MTTVIYTTGGDQYADNFYGSGTGLTNIPRSGIAAGTSDQIVINDGSGKLSSISILDVARGGTGINSTGQTGMVSVNAGIWSIGAGVVDDADVATNANIARSKLASGNANYVLINDASGVMSAEARLATTRGGTGIDTSSSTGIAKVSAGTWSISSIVDADIASNAAVARSKIAAGTSNQVIINDVGGNLASVALLSPSMGGTGKDFSSNSTSKIAIVGSGGVFDSIGYGTDNAESTIVQRDATGSIAVNDITAEGTVNSNAIISISNDLILNSATKNIKLSDNVLHQTPSTTAGGDTFMAVSNIQTTDATTTNFYSLATASGTKGTVYTVLVTIAAGDATGGSNTGVITYMVKIKNLLGVVSASGAANKTTILDTGFGISSDFTISSQNVIFRVTGIASTTINWTGRFEVVSQQF